ncbi:MAG: ankyrin repeat domain-containing protein [Elusimicrobiota bacterium]
MTRRALVLIAAALVPSPSMAQLENLSPERLCEIGVGDYCPETAHTKLVRAAHACRLDEVRSLIETEGLDPNVLEEKTATRAVNAAAFAGCLPVVQYLRNAGAALDLADALGWTPLMVAAAKCRDAVVSDLLCRGKARLDIADRFGDTALALARRAASAEASPSCAESLRLLSDPASCP